MSAGGGALPRQTPPWLGPPQATSRHPHTRKPVSRQQQPPPPPPIRSTGGRYVSYWNAYLYLAELRHMEWVNFIRVIKPSISWQSFGHYSMSRTTSRHLCHKATENVDPLLSYCRIQCQHLSFGRFIFAVV